jgi:hypothetical protein
MSTEILLKMALRSEAKNAKKTRQKTKNFKYLPTQNILTGKLKMRRRKKS